MSRALQRTLAAIAVVGALGAIYLAWLPLSTAIAHFVIDDTGYYLATARNVAIGRGVSVDGETPTNGFHPLWLVLLVVTYRLFGPEEAAVLHVALTICAICFVLTGVFLWREVRRNSRWFAAPFAALFFCNYRLVSIPLGGLETALAGLTVVMTALTASRWVDELSPWKATLLGGLLGLTFLARLDALLFGAVLLTWMAYRALVSRVPSQFWLTVQCGAVSAVMLVPWLVFSWRTVHAWLPRSGYAILLWAPSPWNRPWTVQRLSNAFRGSIVNPAGNVANIFGLWPLVNGPGLSRLSGALALAGGLGLLTYLAWQVRREDRIRRLLWIPIFGVFHAGYYLQYSANQRYLYTLILLMFYFSAAVVTSTVNRRDLPSDRIRISAVIAAMVVMALIAGYQAYVREFGAHYTQGMAGVIYDEITPWVAHNTEPSARVGSFNGGILSTFSHRTILNLDGVMSERAIAAIQSHALCTYIDAQNIRYLVDDDEAIEMFFDRDSHVCGRTGARSGTLFTSSRGSHPVASNGYSGL